MFHSSTSTALAHVATLGIFAAGTSSASSASCLKWAINASESLDARRFCDGSDTYSEDPQEARATRKGLPWPPEDKHGGDSDEKAAAEQSDDDDDEGEDTD